jgi:hypothetical protein
MSAKTSLNLVVTSNINTIFLCKTCLFPKPTQTGFNLIDPKGVAAFVNHVLRIYENVSIGHCCSLYHFPSSLIFLLFELRDNFMNLFHSFSLREKDTTETCLHEEQRRADHASPSSHLTL